MIDDAKIQLFGLLALCIVIALIIAHVVRADQRAWNNGYCECGGRWTYVHTVYYGTNTRTHLYKCDKCGKMYEFNAVR